MNSVLSVKENTLRYKSFTGFVIFLLGAIFAYGKRYALRGVRDLYHIATDRKRGNIAFERKRKYIEFA